MAMRIAVRVTLFIGVFYVALPAAFVALNRALHWPRLQGQALDAAGTLLIVCGIAVCLQCAAVFWRIGGGTPAPNVPPTQMVIAGLYRYSRNPMYVAYAVIAFGIFLVEGDVALMLYVAVFFAIGEVYLVKHEEPILRERYGEAYEAYCRRVPRWLGRVSST